MTGLVIFDVDGTLVDSQTEIMAAMTAAFAVAGLDLPPRADVLAIVGLSLPEAFARLLPGADAVVHDRLTVAYKAAFADRRMRLGAAAGGPLFPGAVAAMDALRDAGFTLAVATGKSKRGLRAVLEGHGLQGRFATEQTSDDHPSKPHPGMVLACLAATDIPAARAVMVGDTSFDMDMGRAAGVAGVAVTWGYHAGVTGDRVIDRFDALPGAVADLIGVRA
jgi:phosphoglycolate phosphatase